MDSEGFKRLVMPYHRMLYRVAYRMTGNEQDAEDLLQDALMRLWQRRHLLSAEVLTEAYLIIVVRNLWRDRLRAKTLDSATELTENHEPPDMIRPDEEMERTDEAFLMKGLIDQLPQKERSIIRMYLMDELSYGEIEQATGFTQGNIRQIVMRTRQKLKEQFIKIARTWMN